MKRVIWSAHISVPVEGSGRCVWELQVQGEADFHTFGVDYEEFETGAGNFSTAIIELDDGTIKNVPVEHIKFIKEDEQAPFFGKPNFDGLTIRKQDE